MIGDMRKLALVAATLADVLNLRDETQRQAVSVADQRVADGSPDDVPRRVHVALLASIGRRVTRKQHTACICVTTNIVAVRNAFRRLTRQLLLAIAEHRTEASLTRT